MPGPAKFAGIVTRWTPEQRTLARQLFAFDGRPVIEAEQTPSDPPSPMGTPGRIGPSRLVSGNGADSEISRIFD
jgi:hypothetical protein